LKLKITLQKQKKIEMQRTNQGNKGKYGREGRKCGSRYAREQL
jgi:hypothetical protein